ncbi:MAG: arsenate reductase family protein [Hyphomicrobiales bacterium]|nr:arsenate reductase family protein [Hyphomicrobiales bacterium]MDE2017089.1 arsenate reductase family protein [Hyphomicrobiales bacterium]
MSDDFPVTIYHNPACGTSRNVVAMVRAAGYEPTVVEYRVAGWTKLQLLRLFTAAGLRPRDALRIKGTDAATLGLTGDGVADDAILDAMVADPILVERPLVVTPKGTILARPSEAVLTVLDRAPASFTKEDGETVRGPGSAAEK